MYFEHINLFVRDLDASKAFYQAAFPHWKIRGHGNRPWYGKPTNWAHLGDDTFYLALNDGGEGENRDLASSQLGLAHFAFAVDNLYALKQRLESAGFKVSNAGADEPFRQNVYFLDPDGYEVEFVEYLSDIPAERNLYR